MTIRNAAKALIQRGDRILVTENTDDNGLWYILPGGGVEPGKETLLDALKRECQEEIGAAVTVEGLQFVREYIADNHEYFSSWTKGCHLIDFIFRCSVEEGYDASSAPNGDSIQVGVKWMSIDELKNLRFYPRTLLDYLRPSGPEPPPVYLGDVN